MKKSFLSLILIVSALITASAGNFSRHISGFDGISLGDCFNVSLEKGGSTSVVMDIPDKYSEFICCKVENSILKLSFDQKKLSKDMKDNQIKLPVNVSITVSNMISSIKIEGKSTISIPDGTMGGDNISISATDQSKITSFSSTKAGKISLILTKRAVVESMVVSANSLMVTASNGSSIEIEQKTSETTIDASGSTSMVISGSTSDLKISTKGSSKSILNGNAQDVSYECSATSNVNASNLQSNSSSVKMSGPCTLSVGVSKCLSLSLNSGAILEFYGEPTIKINEIKSSTVKHLNLN